MSKLHDQAILAGINDDSFETAYRNQSQAQQQDKVEKLKQLFQRQSVEDNLRLAEGTAAKNGLKPGKYSVNASESGFSVNPESDDLIKALALHNAQNDRRDKQVETMGKRIEDKKIPEAVQNLKEVTDAIPADAPMKSIGPLKNAVPDWGVAALEGLGNLTEKSLGKRVGFDKGAAAERAALAAAKTQIRQPLFGSSLTPGEKRSFEDAFGAPIGGSEENVKSAIRRMQAIPQAELSNIESSTPVEAVQRFQTQGGLSSNKLKEFFTPKPAASAGAQSSGLTPEQRQARIAELRSKLSQGN